MALSVESLLKARCSDQFICLEQISEHIDDWKELAPFFSITEAEEMAVKGDHSKVQKLAMLWKWVQKNGNKATFRKMKDLFVQAGNEYLADKLDEILLDKYSHSPQTAVTAFKLYLKDCYKKPVTAVTAAGKSWPPLANTPYVAPELIKVIGSGGVVRRNKRTEKIQLDDLFQDKTKPHKILLEGTAGSGKTTLSRNMCQEWERGKLLDHMDLLIHLTLADPKVWSAQSLEDLIPHPFDGIRKAVADMIIEQRGEKCCFIMDGWEDLPDNEARYIRDFVDGSKLGLALPHCSFIVTSRPIASASLKWSLETVEITGFSSESVDAYATQYLTQQGKDPTVFITALHDNHHARGLCNLPINAAILLHLFLIIGTGFPTTQTELFKCFIVNILLRHLVAKQGHNPSRVRLRNFSSLPKKERQVFDQLCCIAHCATFNTRSTSRSNQLLSLEDLEKEGVDELQETMGLMKVHTQLTLYGYDPYYGFLHSSVQDFLCAVRISQLSPEEQVMNFERIMSTNPMSLVLLFYAGMTKLDNSSVCKYLQQIGKKPPEEMEVVPNICDTLSEARDSRRLFLAFLHCLREANRNDLHVKLCRTEDTISIAFIWYRLSMNDINVIFHSILDMAKLYYPTRISLCLGVCDINDHKIESAVEILINRANTIYQQSGRCLPLGLALYSNNLTHKGVRFLAKLIGADGISLISLDISRNLLIQESADAFEAHLVAQPSSAFEALKTLIEAMSSRSFFLPLLQMYCCGLTSRHAYHLILLLRQNIDFLEISENRLEECVPILVSAARRTSLLDLRGTFVVDKQLIQIGGILQSNTSLKQLSIGFGVYDEFYHQIYLKPAAICGCIELITASTSKSALSCLTIPDCYIEAVDSNDRVQNALRNFALRRGYPLLIVRFSVIHGTFAVGRGFAERLHKLSVPDSLLRGEK